MPITGHPPENRPRGIPSRWRKLSRCVCSSSFKRALWLTRIQFQPKPTPAKRRPFLKVISPRGSIGQSACPPAGCAVTAGGVGRSPTGTQLPTRPPPLQKGTEGSNPPSLQQRVSNEPREFVTRLTPWGRLEPSVPGYNELSFTHSLESRCDRIGSPSHPAARFAPSARGEARVRRRTRGPRVSFRTQQEFYRVVLKWQGDA
jgi:hypothetical protein